MDPTSIHDQGLPTAKPEDEGFSSTRLERLKVVMQEYVDQKKLAGVITVVARRGKVVHFECLGMRNLAAKKPILPDTIPDSPSDEGAHLPGPGGLRKGARELLELTT